MPARIDETIPGMFMRQSAALAGRPLFLSHQPDGRWQPVSWTDACAVVTALAAYFVFDGIRPGERVLILSENRPEWGLADIAIQSVGAWSVPLYPNLREDDVCKIGLDCAAAAAVVSTPEQQSKLLAIRSRLPALRRIITLSAPSEENSALISWSHALLKGAEQQSHLADHLDDRLRTLKASDTATLIYTSGTTGEPKGVMLSHRNFLSNVDACLKVIPITSKDVHLSFLPLSHVFERMAGWYLMLAAAARVAYARDMDSVAEDMRAVRPTVMLGVPRFFEKLHAGIQEHVRALAPHRQKIVRAALAVGRARATRRLEAKRVSPVLWIQSALARLLVFRKFHERLGGRLRFFVSGGAPLSKELGEFFYSIGVTIIEGYGLTETSPVIAANRVSSPKFGTVGLPVPGVEVRIAEDGEVLTRGPHVMQGYYRHPEMTAAVVQNGWFHTGDIGHMDSEGRLCITDRKKDLIKTAGGKFVAPQKLEGLFCGDPHISQAFVYGDRQPYCVALIVPNRDALSALAREKGLPDASIEEMVRHPLIRNFYWALVQAKQATLPGFEQVKRIALLDREFSLGSGELTPTLKAKRQVVADRHAAVLRGLYAAPAEPTGHHP